ncbi:MAG: hypothetical protein JEZ03_15025 [Bacteroidales bacterium]|nr:hypothetical protein [Bacteroidales bacterium]
MESSVDDFVSNHESGLSVSDLFSQIQKYKLHIFLLPAAVKFITFADSGKMAKNECNYGNSKEV